jgi:hypothetical protein
LRPFRGRPFALVGLVGLVALVAIGCGSPPPSTEEPVHPLQAPAEDGEFRLVVTADTDRYVAGAPISVATELSYLGLRPAVRLVGSGSGLVQVSLLQLDGPLRIDAASTADCANHKIAPGAPIARPYAKSGGWSGEDPNAGFYQAFFADPVLRLPRGTWRVVARAEFYVDDCPGPAHKLEAAVELVVE